MMDRKLLLLVEIMMTSWTGICFEVVNLTRLAAIVLGKRGIKSNSQTFGLKNMELLQPLNQMRKFEESADLKEKKYHVFPLIMVSLKLLGI